MPQWMRLAATVALLPLVVGACARIVTPRDFAGDYALSTLNGLAVPAVMSVDGAGSIEITGAQLRLNDDLTFFLRRDFRRTTSYGSSSTFHVVATGGFDVSSKTVMLYPAIGTPYSMSRKDSGLTQVDGLLTLVYLR
ncbi:MAG TPA: hypothetical protein VFT29_19105 [Gemmatimonadaceae bacterium]|nr:hypothetical protein [Gemmatimonadaceae bacterium]